MSLSMAQLSFHSLINSAQLKLGHARRMRTGVAADNVPAGVQFPDLLRIEKTRPSGPIGGYEEVSTPAALFQLAGHARVRADRAIVERQENRHFNLPLPRAVDYPIDAWSGAAADRIQMCAEVTPIQLIPSGVA
jgi:hypothetical protein